MELSERAFATTLFQAHADACRSGTLPSFDLLSGLQPSAAFGKAIIYARRDSRILDSAAWLDDPDVRDVPRSGQRFRKGQPVCSVFAAAVDSDSCYRELVARAECIYRQLEQTTSNRSITMAG